MANNMHKLMVPVQGQSTTVQGSGCDKDRMNMVEVLAQDSYWLKWWTSQGLASNNLELVDDKFEEAKVARTF